jgi:hypothetical protein
MGRLIFGSELDCVPRNDFQGRKSGIVQLYLLKHETERELRKDCYYEQTRFS